jgi:CDP-paratose 2-epimerase
VKTVITGGAGFIGSNLAAHLLRGGDEVVVFDNLARPGTALNAQWLQSLPGNLRVVEADVRDYAALRTAVRDADAVFHLAAQVAVTSSITDPRTDFEVNALGTFNVLEAIRNECPSAFLGYSSTNKVYGDFANRTYKNGSRYLSVDRPDGVSENCPLDLHSPYGCSKGAGDQYVRDYSRIYGLCSVVFRQSCIYGPHQFGNEDQGWVAHFMIQALKRRPITIYGDGLQVRDVLHVDDLIACYEAARDRDDDVTGEIFNIGGGPANTVSLIELVQYLEASLGERVVVDYTNWRPGDQRVYVSDITKAAEIMGWEPSIGLEIGLGRLEKWLTQHLAQLP